MQARAAWMKSMNENLAANKLADVSKDAAALSAQAKQVGESATNPLAKELHLAVSGLAKATAEAAAKNDGGNLSISYSTRQSSIKKNDVWSSFDSDWAAFKNLFMKT